MPRINISETEQTLFTAFDATENVVLVPILYAREYGFDDYGDVVYETKYVESKKYTSYKNFVEDMADHYLTVDNEVDKSYIMAYELLLQGLSVVVKPILFNNAEYDVWNSEGVKIISNTISLEDAYLILEDKIGKGALEEFKDRNLFNIKFITSGGYANCGNLDILNISLGSFRVLQNLAEARGDAIALVEFRPLFNTQEDLLEEIKKAEASEYAAAFFPWCTCLVTAAGVTDPIDMPASYCYLSAYANTVQFNANWFAAAGVTRGRIPSLIKPLFEVGEALMHILQNDDNIVGKLAINPVYNAGSYGYKIWGNRVLQSNTKDLYKNFLNVRVLLCDIKKQIYHAAMRVTFEPNDDIVWVNFKTLASSPLERMKSGRGISWYKWTREYVNQKATIKATLTVKPIEAVENFDITVVLTDEDASISEADASI